jgi:hypothetical protein
MTFILNQTFNNPALPVDLSFRERILAMPGSPRWFQANAALATLSGSAITALADKAGGGTTLGQGTSGSRPTLVDNLFGAYPGIRCDGSNDHLLLSGSYPNTSSPFTWVVVARDPTPTAFAGALSNFTAVGVGTYVGVADTGNAWLGHGDASIASLAFDATKPVVMTLGCDGSNLYASVNGQRATVATDNTGASSFLVAGALNTSAAGPWQGDISDIILFSACLFTDTAQIDCIEAWAARAYGITLE